MSASPDLAGIVISGLDPAPVPPPTPNPFERLANAIYNAARRPLVKARAREVKQIAQRLHVALGPLVSSLEGFGKTCPICRFNAMNLRAEVFASTMRRIITISRCRHHEGPYNDFALNNSADFDRSEKLSAWINGF